MLFNSYTFLFFYLPVVLAGAFALARYRIGPAVAWLVLASLFFYGWWNPRYLVLLLSSIGFNYVAGEAIARRGLKASGRGFGILCGAVATNLAVLGYFKYAGFILESAGVVMGAAIRADPIVLPLGISFFTFTQIAYLVDVYRAPVRYSIVPYGLFVSYFPHLIAGPILHHREMMPQFADPASYRLNYMNLSAGLTILAIGLFKKTVLADGIAPFASPVFEHAARGYSPGSFEAWGAATAFGLQLYFDFSGYSDMAVGMSKMLGIRLPVNFDSPYKATSVIEFWRRWHMTLSRFLRDYVYIPLGGNRHGTHRRYANLLVTMLLGGLWHGAAWTFVLWGFAHGAFLAANHAWRAVRGQMGPVPAWIGGAGRGIGAALTFVAVFGSWGIFRSNDLPSAMSFLAGLAGMNGHALPPSLLVEIGEAARWVGRGSMLPSVLSTWILAHFGAVDANVPTGLARGGNAGVLVSMAQLTWIAVLFAIAWFTPNTRQIMANAEAYITSRELAQRPTAFQWRVDLRWAIACAVLFAASLCSMTRVSEFLYFQF